MCITKITWLCKMEWDNFNQQTDRVLKCCLGHSEMPEQSVSSKYFCIIVLHDCKQIKSLLLSHHHSTNSRHPPLKDRICCVSSARSQAQVIYHIWKVFINWLFLVIFSGIRKWRFSSFWLVGWKRCFIHKCFMRYSSFAQVKFESLDGKKLVICLNCIRNKLWQEWCHKLCCFSSNLLIQLMQIYMYIYIGCSIVSLLQFWCLK